MKQDTARRSFNDGRFQEDRGKSLDDKRKGVGLHRPPKDQDRLARPAASPGDEPEAAPRQGRPGYSE